MKKVSIKLSFDAANCLLVFINDSALSFKYQNRLLYIDKDFYKIMLITVFKLRIKIEAATLFVWKGEKSFSIEPENAIALKKWLESYLPEVKNMTPQELAYLNPIKEHLQKIQ